MANPWLRLWVDMPNDPKWRTIARVSKQPISAVIAVYIHMMTCASNATVRGSLDGWCDEDIATALDIDTEQVEEIRQAMQGRVLDGESLTGWEKRQPKREREDDNSSNRVREHRANKNNETPCNAKDNQETPRGEEIRGDTDNPLINPDGLIVPSDADDDQQKQLKPAKPDCPHQEIIAIYHEVLPMCPQIRDWTPARATQLRARWNEDRMRQNLEYWKRLFEYIKTCDFLVGKTAKPFFADLEWIVKSANFTKIREAKYENKQ